MAGFRFKQFEIKQDRCAMKVGTDGVLLGAWAMGGKRILDVGCGTGLVALMMAQRYPNACVVGIDIDEEASVQASENVLSSPFADRVEIVHCRLQDYCVEEDTVEKPLFDAIVSNPPFFVNSQKAPDAKRTLARHADSLPFRDLLVGVKRLLAEDGEFSVIIPSEVVELMESEAYMLGFFLLRKCAVKTVVRKAPKRYMLSFAKTRLRTLSVQEEIMTNNFGERSGWYLRLTQDFYLEK